MQLLVSVAVLYYDTNPLELVNALSNGNEKGYLRLTISEIDGEWQEKDEKGKNGKDKKEAYGKKEKLRGYGNG